MSDNQQLPKNYSIRCKVDNMKIPPEKWFVGKKSVTLDFQVVPLLNPDEYGNTHTVYIYDSVLQKKIYIGTGRLRDWDKREAPDPTLLPPTITRVEPSDEKAPEHHHNDDEMITDVILDENQPQPPAES